MMISTLTMRFDIASPLCPACMLPMHVDSFKFDSPTRTIMCISERCLHFGFAWTLNVHTGIGTSERTDEEFKQA
jgi:hypothetical protein